MGASVARRLASAQGAQSKKMKRKWMKLLTRISIACLVSLLGVGYTTSDSSAKVTHRSQNQISHLSLQRRGDQNYLWLKGTKKVKYATFVLDDPLRLVIDFQNADLQGLKGPFSYDSGHLVRSINVRQFSNREKSIGRLVLLLQPNTQWLIRPKGKRLLVLFRKNRAPQENPTPQLQPAATAKVAPVQVEQPAPKAKMWGANRLPSRFGGKGPAPTSAVVRRTGIRHNASNGRSARRLLSVKMRKRSIFLRTDGSVSSYEVLTLRNPSRLVVDLYQVRRYRRSLRRQLRRLRCSRSPFRSVRFGRHLNKLRLVFDLCEKSLTLPRYRASLRRRGLRIRVHSLRKAAQRKVVKAQAPTLTKVRQPRKARSYRARLYKGTAMVQNIGVSATQRQASLVIQVDGRKPRIRRTDMGKLTLIDVSPAKLAPSIARSLDTTEFYGALEQIDVYHRGNGVRIALRKTNKASISWRQKAGTLKINVANPNPKAKVVAQGSKSKKYAIPYDAKRVGQAAAASGLSAGDLAILSRNNKRKRYRGRRISIFFRKVEIHNLLRLFAEISGLNIITSNNVKGSVTLRLRNVPWDQALELVLKTLKLGMEREGNIVRIATLNELRQEEQARRRLQQVKLLAQAQKIRLIPVNYATASAMSTQVRTVLSPRGKVTVDQRTNVLIVRDYVPFLIRAEGLVRSLDTQTPQVLIETRIVEANINFDQQFGIQWGGHLLFSPLTGNGTGLQFPNPIGIRGSVPNLQGGQQGGGDFGTPNYIINFPATVNSGRGTALSFLFGSLTGAASLNLRLTAAEQSGHVKVISAPKIITLHKMQASIQQGLQIPFTSASAAGTNVQFITASLALNVSPQVTTDGSIFLTMNITNNQPDFSRGGAAGPAISTKTAQTKMLIKDGETMVIGGVYSRRTGTSQSKIPFLSQIPVLGLLFKNYTYNDDRAELLIFVTPRIINRAQTLGGRQGS